MIDVYDSECLVHIYRFLQKKCDALDDYIKNHAFNFSNSLDEFGSVDVYDGIINLIARKNQLINLKLIIDDAISNLDEKDKQIIYVKINYNLTIDELCGVLSIKLRTAFRRIERAFLNLTAELNASKYIDKLLNIMESELWIKKHKEEVRMRRMSYKMVAASLNGV